MVGFFSVSSNTFSSIDTFKKTLTSTYFAEGVNSIVFDNYPKETFSFNIKNDTIHSIALHVKSCTPQTADSSLVIKLSGINGTYASNYYKLTSFVQDNNDYNMLPYNWQLLKLSSPLSVSASDTITMSLCTTNPGELTLFGQNVGYNSIDSSIATLSGQVTELGDSNSLFGEQSLDLTGANNNAYFFSNSAYSFNTEDFTIEGWFKITSFNTTWNPLIVLGDGWSYNFFTIWGLSYNAAEKTFYFYRYNTDADVVICKLPFEIFTNTWNHIAVTRNNTTLSLWVNGVNAFSLQINNSISFSQIDQERIKRRVNLQIGSFVKDNVAYYTKMYVSNVRIIRNTAKYQTISVNNIIPTQVYSVLADSVLYRGGSDYLTTENNDVVSRPVTITNESVPPVSSWNTVTGPFAEDPEDNISFLNSRKYITIPSISSMSGDFTIEFWFLYLRRDNKEEFLLDGRTINTNDAFYITLNSVANKIRISESSTVVKDVGDISPGIWYHLSINRRSNIIQIMLNGNVIWSFTSNVVWGGRDLLIGTGRGISAGDRRNFLGYISNLRILRTKSLYFNGFALPVDSFNNEANTVFLLKTGAQIDKGIITTKNYFLNNYIEEEEETDCLIFTPQSTNSPYGPEILDWYRCDTDNYIELLSSTNYDLRGKYWSIDFWIYPVSYGAEQNIINFTNNANYSIKFNNSNQILFNNYPTPIKIPLHTWTHVGITRGVQDNLYSTTKLLINGNLIASLPEDMISLSYTNGVFTEIPWTSSANLFIGSSFKGYISNVHIMSSKNNAPLNIARDEVYPTRAIDGASKFSRVANFSKTTMFYENGEGAFFSSSQPNYIPAPYNILGDKTVRMTWESPSYPDRAGSYIFDGDNILVIENRHVPYSIPGDDFGSYTNERFTYELWFKPYVNNKRMALISSGSGNPQDPEAHVSHIFVNGTEIEVVPMYFYNRKPLIVRSTFMTKGANIKLNEWNHVAVQRNNSMIIECYVNGLKIPFYNNNTLAPTTLAELKAIPSLQNIDGEFLTGSKAVFIGGARKDELNNVFVHSLFQGLMTQIRVSNISLYFGDDVRSILYSDPSYKTPTPLNRFGIQVSEPVWFDAELNSLGQYPIKFNPFKFFLGTKEDQSSYFNYPYSSNTPTEPATKQDTNTQKTVLLLKSPYNKLQNSYINRKTEIFQRIYYPDTISNYFADPDSETSYHINNKNFDLHNSDFTVSTLVSVNSPLLQLSGRWQEGAADSPWYTLMYKILERKGSYVFGVTTHQAAVTRNQYGHPQSWAPGADFRYISLFFGYEENEFLNPEQSLGITPGNITQNLYSGRVADNAYYNSPPSSPPFGETFRVTFIGDYKTRTVSGYINDIFWGTFSFYPKTPTFTDKNIISFGPFSTVSAGYRRNVGPVSRANYNKILRSTNYARWFSDLFIGKQKSSNTLVRSNISNTDYIPQFTDTYNSINDNTVFVLNSSNNYSFTTTNIALTSVDSSYLPSVVSTNSSTSPDTAALYFNGNNTIGANYRTSSVGSKMYMVGYRTQFTFESWVKPVDDFEMIIFSLGVENSVGTNFYGQGYLREEFQTVYPLRVGLQNGRVYFTAETLTLWTEQNVRQYNVNEWFHISISRVPNNFILIAINGQIIFCRQLYRTEITTGVLNRFIGLVQHAGYDSQFRSVLGTICIGGYRNANLYKGIDYTFNFQVSFQGSFRGYMSKLRLQKGDTIYDRKSLPGFNANYTGDNSHIGIHLTTSELQDVNNMPNFISYGPNSADTMLPRPAQIPDGILLNFSGTGQQISIPSKTNFNLFNEAWTFETWVNLFSISNGKNNPIISKGNSYSIYINTNNTISFRNSKSTQTSIAAISRFQWVHLSFVCNTSTIKLYINGVLSHTYTILPSEDNNDLFYIGYNPAFAGCLAGSIANLRLIKGAAEYIQPDNNFTSKNNSVLILKNPYKAFTYTTTIITDIHIGSIVFEDIFEPITVTLDSTIAVSNILIHKGGSLNIVDKGNLTVNGTRGINVTVEGRLNIL